MTPPLVSLRTLLVRSLSLRSRRRAPIWILLGSVVLVASCGKSSTGPDPDFGLSLSPTSLTIAQGASGTSTVTVSRTAFSASVALTLGGAPAGVTGSFNPASATGASSTLTVSVGATVAPGTYDLTVDGVGAPGSRSTALTLTVTAAPPDFGLSASPSALSINQGASGTSTVTINRTNFADAVTLGLGGAPAGVTGSFSPAAPTGTTSTLTVDVAGSVAPGVYALTIDGTGTPGSRSTPLSLTVNPAPNYSVALSPSALTVNQGASGTSSVTLARTNFTGAVTLSLGGAPAGVTGAFNPTAPTGTSSTLTVSVAGSVAPGVYDLTVDGSGTPGSRSAALTLTVDVAPDYSLSLNPAALTVQQGADGAPTVTLTRTNFTGAVTLSLGGAPAGVSGAFNPAAPTGTSSALTVSVGGSVAPGVYNLTVDGTGAAGNRSTPLTLTVTAAPDYSLSLDPAALTIVQGENANTTVTVARTNFAGAVTLTLGGAPAGVTGAFNPPAPTGTSSTLTVSVAGSVAPGVYNLTVDGAGAPGNRSTGLTLTVTATPDYSLSLNPAALSIGQGGNAPTTVTVARTNFTGAVTLTLGGAPAGVTGAFNPAAPAGATSTLTVTVGPSVAAGVYNLTVDGSGAPGNRSTALQLTVTDTPDFSLSLNPNALTIGQGANANTTVTVTRTNFTDAVTLSLGGAPSGVTGAFNPTAPTGTSSTLTVTVAGSVAPGVYNLTVNGSGTPGNRSTPLTLTVTATADYSLSLNPAALTIAQSSNGNSTVTITRTNFSGAVTLGLGGAPAGVTGSFNPTAPTGTSSTLTVSVGGAVTPGVYNLTVDGTGTPGNRSTPLTLTVPTPGGGNASVDFSACQAGERPIWAAYQNGSGAWTVVSPVNNVYTFSITAGGGGFAYVTQDLGITETQVMYQSQAEFTSATTQVCGAPPSGKTVSGTAAGLTAMDVASISLGGATAFANFAVPNFQLSGVANGTHDVVGFRSSLAGGATRGFLLRDQNIPDNGSLGTVDFAGANSFATATATITLSGLGGDSSIQNMTYYTGASCIAAPLYGGGTAGASFTATGVPAAPQRTTDFHGLTVVASNATQSRAITQSFNALTDRTITLPTGLPVPTITQLAGTYQRMQAVYTLPAEYNGLTSADFDDGGNLSVLLTATIGYLGGTSVTLAMPDFSGLAGWSNAWVPAPSSSGQWAISASGSNGASSCTEGATTRFTSRAGTY